MKPLLLIDVDGPLNPYAAKATRRPEGYQTHRYFARPTPHWGSEGHGMRVWLNPAHGPMLLSLADRFDLTWATSWKHEANLLIAPVIGLPHLPVIEFPDYHPWPERPDMIWKMPYVLEYVGDRPFAWLDDDFTLRDIAEAKGREIPTKLMFIPPNKGILPEDIEALAGWHAIHFAEGA
jgi:hypothetical protein